MEKIDLNAPEGKIINHQWVKKAPKLIEPNTYWRYLELEGKRCLRDI